MTAQIISLGVRKVLRGATPLSHDDKVRLERLLIRDIAESLGGYVEPQSASARTARREAEVAAESGALWRAGLWPQR